MTKKVTKEYLFYFEGGGWNSVFATTKRKAIRLANKEYKSSKTLNPIASSFHLNNNPAHYKSLLNLFY